MIHLSLQPHFLDVWLTYANSGHPYFTLQRSFVQTSVSAQKAFFGLAEALFDVTVVSVKWHMSPTRKFLYYSQTFKYCKAISHRARKSIKCSWHKRHNYFSKRPQNVPPGRLIVSGIATLTENISSFIDSILQRLMQFIPCDIKDTTEFINKLASDKTIPPDVLLVTVDVTSLNTVLIQSFNGFHLIWLIVHTTSLYLIIALLVLLYTQVFPRVHFLALYFSPCILSLCLPLLTHTLSYIIHLMMT